MPKMLKSITALNLIAAAITSIAFYFFSHETMPNIGDYFRHDILSFGNAAAGWISLQCWHEESNELYKKMVSSPTVGSSAIRLFECEIVEKQVANL